MKNKKFVVIALVTLLSLPLSVWAVDNYVSSENETQNQESIIDENSEIEANRKAILNPEQQDDVLQNEVANIAPTIAQKQPLSKKKLAKKFILAMFGVLFSTMMIYTLLTLYNRIRDGVINQVNTPEGETSLRTPDDLSGAIRTFLDKTNW